MAEQEHDDLLTPEEIAAIEAEEGAEIDGSASLTGQDTQEWIDNGWGAAPEEPDTPEDAPTGDDTSPAAPADDDPAAQEPQEQKQQPPEEPEPKAQQSAPVDLSAFDKQLEDKATAAKELLDAFEDGDLSRDEYAEKAAALRAEETQIIEQRAIAKQQVETENQRWDSAVSDYLGEYSGLKGDKVISAFDAEVRSVTSNPAFASKTYAQQLAIAHKRLLTSAEDMGLEGVPELKGAKPPKTEDPKADDPKPDDPKTKQDVRGDDLRDPPPTLAHIPAADMSTDDSKYASLQRYLDDERVSPDDKEAVLAKMSDEERDRFSSMNV